MEKTLPELKTEFVAQEEPLYSKAVNREKAIEFIIWHLKNFPEKHATPEHLVNTYSAMGGHPIQYCGRCSKLLDKYQINHIDGVKAGMYNAYYQEPKQ